MIVRVIPCFARTWRSPRPSLKLTIEPITPNRSRHLSALNHQGHLFLFAHPRKSTSPHITINTCVSTLMRLMSSSSYHQKASPSIQFSGGQGVVHNFRVYPVQHETYSPSQVGFNQLPLNTILMFPKARQLLSSAYFQEHVTLSHYGVQVSSPRPFAP